MTFWKLILPLLFVAILSIPLVLICVEDLYLRFLVFICLLLAFNGIIYCFSGGL